MYTKTLMAANARMSKLSGSKAEQYIFNWRVFTGWDYTIGNQETASNTVMAIVIKLRESIADCRVSLGSNFRCLQFTLRVIANVVICAMLAFSIYCISFAVQKSQTAVEQEGNLFTKNQIAVMQVALQFFVKLATHMCKLNFVVHQYNDQYQYNDSNVWEYCVIVCLTAEAPLAVPHECERE
ncbi:hypothetical protein OESDEN_00151 [Oesophagostomum dentatum]|uniref:Uncharacterized protein n=1 Tax=Oesophagostomum dentatum TaxID=61180 RepID=A0A0B1TVF6_OESDE|nr:hypothetical protein OESDEN_00151 [Oesophagostomum dentatum]